MIRRAPLLICAFFLTVLFAKPAWAHKPSDAYLTLESSGASWAGRWDIALRDLAYALPIDTNGDGALTWGELSAHRAGLEAYAFQHLALSAHGTPCSISSDGLRVVDHSDGTYAVLLFHASCPSSSNTIDVKYNLFFDLDPQHHGLLRLAGPAGQDRTAIFTAAAPAQHFELTADGQGMSFAAAVREGIAHIGSGVDHLLFLLALLLPSVLRRRDGRWQPVSDFETALRDVLRIVTAFTVAHSITLSLSVLDVVRLPSRLVESGIAASVVLAALNNLVPVLRGERWTAAFALGLLHGFGFSAVLVDLGLSHAALARVLFGFNLGVELGQCAAVALFLPIAFVARCKVMYRYVGLFAGSTVIAAVATVWFVQRAFVVI